MAPVGEGGGAPAPAATHADEAATTYVMAVSASQALTRPDKPAFVADDGGVTYAELEQWSNRIANGLLAAPPTAQPVVATVGWLEPAAIALLLGALKTGFALAPLDPREPDESLLATAERLGARLVLLDEERAARLRPTGPRSAIASLAGITSSDDTTPSPQVGPDDPVLIASTSGTTGTPKTVVVTQRAVEVIGESRLVTDPDARVGIMLPPSFAAAYAPIVATLRSGATGHCLDLSRAPISELGGWIERERLTALGLTPSLARAVTAPLLAAGRTLPHVQRLSLSGEPLTGEEVEALRAVMPAATITNAYGSADAGLVSINEMPPGAPVPPGPVTAGVPLREVEIVDDDGAPLAPGEVGLVVAVGPHLPIVVAGGEPLDLSVLHTPDVRRVPTGDLGRILPDGHLEVLGRSDHRVKVRGQMVDPTRVEGALTALDGVRHAVVSAVPGASGTVLVAHVVPSVDPAPQARRLRRGLNASLPSHMVPSLIVLVEDLPRLNAGKFDRRAIAEMAAEAEPERAPFDAPHAGTEGDVAGLVAQVLGVERVGRHDDVFDLGCDSLAGVELIVAVNDHFGVEVAPGVLTEHPTVAELAAHIDTALGGTRGRPTLARVLDVVPRRDGGRVLVGLRDPGTGRAPLHLVPGGGANLFQLRPFAVALGDRPVRQFVPKGVDARTRPDASIAAAADRYLAALLDQDDGGPLFLGGSSAGGIVAWEMARRLSDLGRTPDLLVLLDPAGFPGSEGTSRLRATSALVARPVVAPDDAEAASHADGAPAPAAHGAPGPVDTARRLITEVRRRPPRSLARSAAWYAEAAYRSRVPPFTLGLVRRPLAEQEVLFLSHTAWITRRHRAGPYRGDVLLVVSTGAWGPLGAGGVDAVRGLVDGHVDVVPAAGDHESMLRPPHVAALGAAVAAALDALDPDVGPTA